MSKLFRPARLSLLLLVTASAVGCDEPTPFEPRSDPEQQPITEVGRTSAEGPATSETGETPAGTATAAGSEAAIKSLANAPALGAYIIDATADSVAVFISNKSQQELCESAKASPSGTPNTEDAIVIYFSAGAGGTLGAADETFTNDGAITGGLASKGAAFTILRTNENNEFQNVGTSYTGRAILSRYTFGAGAAQSEAVGSYAAQATIDGADYAIQGEFNALSCP